MREGDFQGASNRITKTLQFRPAASTYVTLCNAYFYQHKYVEAAACQQGIGLDAGVYRLWGNLGSAQRHVPGSEAKALDSFGKALELARKSLQVLKSDDATRANIAEYLAKVGEKDKALAQLAEIPESARGPLMDRVVLVYELTGQRSRALAALKSLPPSDTAMNFLKNDPDLESLWRDPSLAKSH